MTIRRILALGTTAALALVAAAAGRPAVGASADSSPATKLTRALAVSHVPARRSSVLAVDLRTGEIVYSRNPGLALAPASNEKLAVSYALLRKLGPAYRIRTAVTGPGRLVGVHLARGPRPGGPRRSVALARGPARARQAAYGSAASDASPAP